MRPLRQKQLDALLSFLQYEDDYVFLDSARSDAENRKSLLFLRPRERLICLPGEDPAIYAAKLEGARAAGYHLAGWMSYEFGYLLEGKLLSSLQYSAESTQPLASFGV
jgi:hypothetical protein